jgi:hypothetical protein
MDDDGAVWRSYSCAKKKERRKRKRKRRKEKKRKETGEFPRPLHLPRSHISRSSGKKPFSRRHLPRWRSPPRPTGDWGKGKALRRKKGISHVSPARSLIRWGAKRVEIFLFPFPFGKGRLEPGRCANSNNGRLSWLGHQIRSDQTEY